MRRTAFACCLLAILVTACGGNDAGSETARKTAATLSGEDKVAADRNPQCKLFTPTELAAFVGVPLASGRVAALGSGCQWVALSGNGSAMIQVVPAEYHEPHSGAPGFKELTDVGSRGFVEQETGGWNAGAITGTESVMVGVVGAGVNEATAIALLKETIKRRGK